MSIEQLQWSRIHVRETHLTSEGGARHHTVVCPVQARTVSFEGCRGCKHLFAIDCGERDRYVVCDVTPTDASATDASATPEPIVSEIMTRDVHCVGEDTTLSELIELFFDRYLSAVPVVDASGAPVGIASKTDVIEAQRRSLDPRSCVGDVMSALVFSIPENTPIMRAAAFMAHQGLHRVPVVDDSGSVVGMLSAIDMMRWIARDARWVVGDRTAWPR